MDQTVQTKTSPAPAVVKPTGATRVLGFFFALRGLMLFASFGALVGSCVMYWVGAKYLLGATGFIHAEAAEGAHQPTVLVLEAMDAFLFAVVLTIFAYGIAVGFVVRLKPETLDILPDWMKVSGIGELKHTLAEVVLVIMIVTFAKDVVEADQKLDWTVLILPVSVLMLAAALWLLKSSKH